MAPPATDLFGPEQLEQQTAPPAGRAEMFGPEQLEQAQPEAMAAKPSDFEGSAQKRSIPLTARRLMETHTPEELQSGAKELGEQEAMTGATLAGGELLGAGAKAAAPFLEENVLPAIERGVPYAGRVLKFAEEAPSAIKAAVRGGTTGAAYGGVEGAFRGHPVRDALVGAVTGGALGAGAYGLGSMASPDFRNVPFAGEAEPPVTAEKPLVAAAQNPEISVRRVPGEIAPEHVGAPAERIAPFPGQGSHELPGNGVLVRPTPLLPGKTVTPIEALGQHIEEAAGTKPLVRDVPIGQQRVYRVRDVGEEGIPATTRPNATTSLEDAQRLKEGRAAVTGKEQEIVSTPFNPEAHELHERPNAPAWVSHRQAVPESAVSRVPRAVGADVPFKPSAGQTAGDVVNQNTEVEATRPLASGPQKSKSLREIISEGPPKEPVTHRATVTHEGKTFGMEAANGRKMYEATQGDTALAKQVHDLKNTEVRQAFVNGGGDVNTVGQEGQRFKVGNSSSKERAQMFDWLLDQGFRPRDIIALARRKP